MRTTTANTCRSDEILAELEQLSYARATLTDWQSAEGAIVLAANFGRERELWAEVVNDRSTSPLLVRAAIAAQIAAAEHVRFWDDVVEQKTSGRPA